MKHIQAYYNVPDASVYNDVVSAVSVVDARKGGRRVVGQEGGGRALKFRKYRCLWKSQ